jgi:hypothetical protein
MLILLGATGIELLPVQWQNGSSDRYDWQRDRANASQG